MQERNFRLAPLPIEITALATCPVSIAFLVSIKRASAGALAARLELQDRCSPSRNDIFASAAPIK